MGFLNSFRSWLSPDAKSESQREVQALLITSMQVVGAYGGVIEKSFVGSTPSIKFPETALPHPKQVIAQAIANLQHVISDPSLKPMIVEVLEPDAANHVLSPPFSKFLAEGLAMLEFFVPASEVESDRKNWQEMLPVLDKLGPDARARYGHLFGDGESPPRK